MSEAEKKVDRRVRKTKRQLRQALMELMNEKPIQKITVREISDRVDIHRGTFYLHYRDVYDMLDQVEQEMEAEIQELLENHPVLGTPSQPMPLIRPCFEYFLANADAAKALIGPNGDRAFTERIKSLVREHCFKDFMERFDVSDPKEKARFDYYYSFIVVGCLGMLESWIHDGMVESPEEMESMIEEVILRSIGFLGGVPKQLTHPDKAALFTESVQGMEHI